MLSVSDNQVNRLGHWSNSCVRILQGLMKEGILTEADLSQAVSLRLKAIGRACYKSLHEPDHTPSPQAFAFALREGEFTPEEETRIVFDHGETKATFIALYNRSGKDFVEAIVQQLLTEWETPKHLGSELVCCGECFESH